MAKHFQTKRCSVCKEEKSLADFHKNSSRKDGHCHSCKNCKLAESKRYRQTVKGKTTLKTYRQREKVHKYNLQYQNQYRQSETGKITRKRYLQSAKCKQYEEFYAIGHPERRKAKDAVCYAIKVGKLVPANTLQCQICKETAREYHHPSYKTEDRLKVIPVCFVCHKKIHTKEKVCG